MEDRGWRSSIFRPRSSTVFRRASPTVQLVKATRWLYDPKNKEGAIAIHMKVLKSTRESADEDYKYLVQDFQPFPKDGLVSKVS
jgi:hypothetical protein